MVYTESNVNCGIAKVFFNVLCSTILTMLTAYFISQHSFMLEMLHQGWMIGLILVPFAIILMVAFLRDRIGPRLAYCMLLVFAICFGGLLAPIFLMFSMTSILAVFGFTVVLFGGVSIVGYFTKYSLDSLGWWLTVGLFGVIVAGVANYFIGSSMVETCISLISVALFIGFTAYDTKMIKERLINDPSPSEEILGAFSLYLDLFNLFINLLKIFAELR